MNQLIRITILIITLYVVSAKSTNCQSVICIDPGHGGSQPGATTPIDTFPEMKINLKVAQYLLDSLEAYECCLGAEVIFTRDNNDSTLSLSTRAFIANSNNAQFFISIHHNATSNPDAIQGTETWYCSELHTPSATISPYNNKQRNTTDSLAKKIYLNLKDSTHGFGYKKRYCQDSDLTVLHQTTMPSVLSEASFVSEEPDPLEAWRFM